MDHASGIRARARRGQAAAAAPVTGRELRARRVVGADEDGEAGRLQAWPGGDLQTLGSQDDVAAPAITIRNVALDEPCILEHEEMVRDEIHRRGDEVGQLLWRAIAQRERVDDREPPSICERGVGTDAVVELHDSDNIDQLLLSQFSLKYISPPIRRSRETRGISIDLIDYYRSNLLAFASMASDLELLPKRKRVAGEPCCQPAFYPEVTQEKAEHLAHVAKALGDPIRLQLVDVLRKHAGKVCVCELVPLFDIGQTTLSHHLKKLREAGIVDSERRGLWAYYYVKPDSLAALSAWLAP
jgi:ArsR family transcriptional regulator